MDILTGVNGVDCFGWLLYLTCAEKGIVIIVSGEDDKAGGSNHIYTPTFVTKHGHDIALLTEWELCNHLGRSGPFLRGE